VLVLGPTAEETTEMLHALKGRYERFHRVCIADEATIAAVELADRYIEGHFARKAIDLIDCASVGSGWPPKRRTTNQTGGRAPHATPAWPHRPQITLSP
jgi:hypothetical protein